MVDATNTPVEGIVLAFDYGLAQIGVAVGETLTGSARPLALLAASDGVPDWQYIEQLISEYQPVLLVVGLPLDLDGETTPMSARAKKFANRLHGRFGLPVELQDERFSSKAAKQNLRDSEYSEQRRSGRRKRGAALDAIDAEAATLILESFFARG